MRTFQDKSFSYERGGSVRSTSEAEHSVESETSQFDGYGIRKPYVRYVYN